MANLDAYKPAATNYDFSKGPKEIYNAIGDEGLFDVILNIPQDDQDDEWGGTERIAFERLTNEVGSLRLIVKDPLNSGTQGLQNRVTLLERVVLIGATASADTLTVGNTTLSEQGITFGSTLAPFISSSVSPIEIQVGSAIYQIGEEEYTLPGIASNLKALKLEIYDNDDNLFINSNNTSWELQAASLSIGADVTGAIWGSGLLGNFNVNYEGAIDTNGSLTFNERATSETLISAQTTDNYVFTLNHDLVETKLVGAGGPSGEYERVRILPTGIEIGSQEWVAPPGAYDTTLVSFDKNGIDVTGAYRIESSSTLTLIATSALAQLVGPSVNLIADGGNAVISATGDVAISAGGAIKLNDNTEITGTTSIVGGDVTINEDLIVGGSFQSGSLTIDGNISWSVNDGSAITLINSNRISPSGPPSHTFTISNDVKSNGIFMKYSVPASSSQETRYIVDGISTDNAFTVQTSAGDITLSQTTLGASISILESNQIHLTSATGYLYLDCTRIYLPQGLSLAGPGIPPNVLYKDSNGFVKISS